MPSSRQRCFHSSVQTRAVQTVPSTMASRGRHVRLCVPFCQVMYFKRHRLATWGSRSLVYFPSGNTLLCADTFTKHPLILSFKRNGMDSDQACSENVCWQAPQPPRGHMAVPGRHLLGILLQFSSQSEGPGGWEGISALRAPPHTP